MTRATQKRLCSTLFSVLLLSTAFNPVRADSACHYIEEASLDVAQSADAAVATVAGELNGQPINLSLDTGAANTVLLRSAVEKLGLSPYRTRMQIPGGDGNTSLFKVKIKDIAIGGAHAKNLTFPVIDTMENTGVEGIVGVNFLMQYDVELHLAENRIKLFRADHCKDKALAYWDKDAASVPMEYIGDTPRPRIQVKVNDVTIWALIDTGAVRSTVDLDTARRLGMTTAAREMTFTTFAIGDEVIQHPRLAVVDSVAPGIGRREHDMVLGRDFLRAHHVLLAQSQMLVYFSYNGGPVFTKDALSAAR